MLGHLPEDMVYIIGQKDGDVTTSNTIRPLPEDELWDFERCRGVKGLPWAPRPSQSLEDARREECEEAAEHDLPPVPTGDDDFDEIRGRGMEIIRAILQRHGLHPGRCEDWRMP